MIIIALGEIIALSLLGIALLAYGLIMLSEWYDQKVCPHNKGVNETRSCDAICRLCGKNLGFIGTEENKIRRGQR